MATIPYSGGTIVNTTFVSDGTRLNMVNNLNTQLKNAGWTAISGDGTADVLLESATTVGGQKIRFRLYDPGSGNCAQITMKNSAGTLTSAIGYMLPTNGKTFRIWANKYWSIIFSSGAVNRRAAREIYAGGTLICPDNIVSIMGADLECGWAQYTGNSDTSVLSNQSVRNDAGISPQSLNVLYGSSLYTSFMVNYTSYSNQYPTNLCVQGRPDYWGTPWQDLSCFQTEAVMSWSSTNSAGGAPRAKGWLPDAMIVGASVDGETTTITWDGHTWMPITDKADNSQTLYVRTDT